MVKVKPFESNLRQSFPELVVGLIDNVAGIPLAVHQHRENKVIRLLIALLPLNPRQKIIGHLRIILPTGCRDSHCDVPTLTNFGGLRSNSNEALVDVRMNVHVSVPETKDFTTSHP